MIEIVLSQHYGVRGRRTETANAWWNGRGYRCETNAGASCALARRLVADGCEDGPWIATRGFLPVLRGASLHERARWTFEEGPNGPRRVRAR